MEIIKAEHSGFCFGVKNAVKAAEDAVEREGRIFTLGELTHNEDVIAYLRNKNIIDIESVDDERISSGDTIVIRSHGVPIDIYSKCTDKGLNVIDATCPFVKKISDIVFRRYNDGYSIIIVGERNHPEVIGINSRSNNNAYIVMNESDVDKMPFIERACVVAQTTLKRETFDIVLNAAKKKCKELIIENTICNTTRERQAEAEELSKKCSAMIVIGSAKSSNTKKLYEICKKNCKKTERIENHCDIGIAKYSKNDIIGIVTGASTPHWIIREVFLRMSELEKTMAESPKKVKKDADAVVNESNTAEGENFADMLDASMVRLHEGDLVTGTVIQIVDGEIGVNLRYKRDGLIPRSEFSSDPDEKPEELYKIGDEIEVEVLKVNDDEGNVKLSRKNVMTKKLWDELLQDPDVTEKEYEAVGKEAVKGGLVILINGIRAFVPASQLTLRKGEPVDASEFVGKTLTVRIIDIDKQKKRIVASYRNTLKKLADEKRQQIWDSLKVGDKVKGTVRRLTDFGAFVDIGGIDGLIRKFDISWSDIEKPEDVLSVDQEIEVEILSVDKDKKRIGLGYKQLQPRPWTFAEEKYPVGSIVEGKVEKIVPFGAFVALERTIRGLVHISQIGVRRIAKVEDEINVGDVIRCKVLEVNAETKHINLSRRDVILEEHPEIVEELNREKEERAQAAAERKKQRMEQIQAEREQQKAAREQQKAEREQQRRERAERADRPERSERRRRDDADYQLPTIQQSTTSLADLLSGFKAED